MQGFLVWGVFETVIAALILAAGMAFLLTQDFPTDAWTMLRPRRHHEPAVAAQDAHRPELVPVSHRRTHLTGRMDRSR